MSALRGAITEIDDPANAFRVDKGTVEHEVNELGVTPPCQRIFAVHLGVAAIEQPASA